MYILQRKFCTGFNTLESESQTSWQQRPMADDTTSHTHRGVRRHPMEMELGIHGKTRLVGAAGKPSSSSHRAVMSGMTVPSGCGAVTPTTPLSTRGSEAGNNNSSDLLSRQRTVTQLSTAPVTHTTVTTTTTTTMTTFKPVELPPLRSLDNLDGREYPLCSIPTPADLRDLVIDFPSGQQANFRESADPVRDMESLQVLLEMVDKSGGQQLTQVHKKKSTLGTSLKRSASSMMVDGTTTTTPPPPSKRVKMEMVGDGLQQQQQQQQQKALSDDDDDDVAVEEVIGQQMPTPTIHTSNEPSFDEMTMMMPSINTTTSPNQTLPLPSPTLSPLTGAAKGSDLAALEEPDYLSLDNSSNQIVPHSAKENLEQQFQMMMKLPSMIKTFDVLPIPVQSYLLHQLLRRSHKSTLQTIASAVVPALQRDFLTLLPTELALSVTRLLDYQSLCRASQVSKKWRSLIEHDTAIWRHRVFADGYRLTDTEIEEDLLLVNSREYHDGESNVPRRSRRSSRLQQLSSSKRPKSSNLTSCATEPTAVKLEGDSQPSLTLESNARAKFHKEMYHKHRNIRQNWMNPFAKPKHISFQGHGDSVVTCLKFDDEKVISASDDNCINIYDIQTGQLRTRLNGHDGGVWALDHVGNTLVTGSTDRTTRVWDIERGVCTHVFYGHTSTVRCLQILQPKPKREVEVGGNFEMLPEVPLIVTGSRDSSLRIWKLPQSDDPAHLPLPPDPENLELNVQTALQQNPFHLRKLEGHTQPVRAVSGYRDCLVSGSYDCSVRVWKVSTGEPVWKLTGHTQKVYSVVYDKKRHRCVSGSMDWRVKVWDLTRGTCLWSLDGKSL